MQVIQRKKKTWTSTSELEWQNVNAGRRFSNQIIWSPHCDEEAHRGQGICLGPSQRLLVVAEPRTFKSKPLDFCSFHCTLWPHWIKPPESSVSSQKSNSLPSTAISFKNSTPFFWLCTLHSPFIYFYHKSMYPYRVKAKGKSSEQIQMCIIIQKNEYKLKNQHLNLDKCRINYAFKQRPVYPKIAYVHIEGILLPNSCLL